MKTTQPDGDSVWDVWRFYVNGRTSYKATPAISLLNEKPDPNAEHIDQVTATSKRTAIKAAIKGMRLRGELKWKQ